MESRYTGSRLQFRRGRYGVGIGIGSALVALSLAILRAFQRALPEYPDSDYFLRHLSPSYQYDIYSLYIRWLYRYKLTFC